MNLLKSIAVTMSTYSNIPMPQFEWKKAHMTFAICFLPLVGVVCALALYAWGLLSQALGIDPILFSSLAVCLPLLITGGIHMDGFMDTCDALSSHQPRERKLEIMKDPSAGAFAVIYFGVYMLLSFGLFYQLYITEHITAIAPIYILSRALTSYTVVSYPSARKKGMLASFNQYTDRQRAVVAIIITTVLSGVLLAALSLSLGLIIISFGIATTLFYHAFSSKVFGGITGDTSGFFLQLCEIICLFGAVIGSML